MWSGALLAPSPSAAPGGGGGRRKAARGSPLGSAGAGVAAPEAGCALVQLLVLLLLVALGYAGENLLEPVARRRSLVVPSASSPLLLPVVAPPPGMGSSYFLAHIVRVPTLPVVVILVPPSVTAIGAALRVGESSPLLPLLRPLGLISGLSPSLS